MLYIVDIEVNSKHIVLILKAKCMDKCEQATGYAHTDLGGFAALTPCVYIIPYLNWGLVMFVKLYFLFILSTE